MADFLPISDDGELYLPSDIYPDEIICTQQNPTNNTIRNRPEFPCELTYMEDLAQQLAALALLERNLAQWAPKPPPSAVQVFGPGHRLQSGFGPEGYSANSKCTVSGMRSTDFLPGSRPIQQLYPVEPSHMQVENYAHARSRFLQNQQLYPVKNRVLPCQPGNGTGTGGIFRGSGGTGVFLPRVVASSWIRKKPNMKYGEENSATGTVGRGMAFQHPSSDMGLPQDWIY